MHLILISLGLTLLAVAQPNLRDAKVAAEQQLQWDQVPLNQFPFLMSHDSATGRYTRTNKFRLTPFPYASSYHHAAVLWCHCTAYGRQGYLDNDPAYWWVKTQTTGFGGQANCGARAFDVRPQFQSDGNIVMHHGPVPVPKSMIDALQELVTFANQNPNELIIVYISHCDGDGCMEATQKAVTGIGVPICTDGNQLYNATYGSTKRLGRLPPGGAMLVIFGDVNENYDDGITCYGGSLNEARVTTTNSSSLLKGSNGTTIKPAVESILPRTPPDNNTEKLSLPQPDFYWYCYGSSASSAFEPLWSYLRQHSAEDPPANGQIQMLQAHWQYNADAIAQGVLHASSILDDESRAAVNSKVADAVLCAPCPTSGGVFKYHNLIEVDNVCDASPKLFNAFRSRVPPNTQRSKRVDQGTT